MTRGQKLLVVLIVCVPVLLMTGIALLHIRREAAHVLDNSEWLVADVIARHIGREVRIGKGRSDASRKRLVLEDVSMRRGPSFAQGKTRDGSDCGRSGLRPFRDSVPESRG